MRPCNHSKRDLDSWRNIAITLFDPRPKAGLTLGECYRLISSIDDLHTAVESSELARIADVYRREALPRRPELRDMVSVFRMLQTYQPVCMES